MLSKPLQEVWNALPSGVRLMIDGKRYLYATRGKPGTMRIISLTSLTRTERAEIIAAKAAQDRLKMVAKPDQTPNNPKGAKSQ